MTSNNLPQIITVELDVKANYADFKNFISNIEQEQRLIDLQSIDMNSQTRDMNSQTQEDSEESPPNFNLSLSLNTYYINKPQFTLP